MPNRTVAIIQARMSSSRLPGKVLLDINGRPMLAHVIERTRRAQIVDQTLVATTSDPSDDALADFCQVNEYPLFRGSLYDVLDRYYQAAAASQAEVIVRITADCPLIDPQVIDKVVRRFLGYETPEIQSPGRQDVDASAGLPYDFAANRLPHPWGRTYPVGLDTEVCTFAALELAWHEASLPYQREHVMPFFYDQPERFRILHVNQEEAVTNLDTGALRWTVDTLSDLELARRIFAAFNGRDDFSWLEVLELVERQPELMQINAQSKAKDYRAFDARSQQAKERTG
jgi:spore coat polysaccharide biosynthesis protein SpsF